MNCQIQDNHRSTAPLVGAHILRSYHGKALRSIPVPPKNQAPGGEILGSGIQTDSLPQRGEPPTRTLLPAHPAHLLPMSSTRWPLSHLPPTTDPAAPAALPDQPLSPEPALQHIAIPTPPGTCRQLPSAPLTPTSREQSMAEEPRSSDPVTSQPTNGRPRALMERLRWDSLARRLGPPEPEPLEGPAPPGLSALVGHHGGCGRRRAGPAEA